MTAAVVPAKLQNHARQMPVVSLTSKGRLRRLGAAALSLAAR